MNGYIKEEDLVKALTEQFKLPYLPVGAYEIPPEVIEMIPAEIVKKYWLVPICRVEDILAVVMSDPLDVKAINELQTITGCFIQPFIGLFSDIQNALGRYYETCLHTSKCKEPALVSSAIYRGVERRKSRRHNASVEIWFAALSSSNKGKTKNLSPNGILFESNVAPVRPYLLLTMEHPKKAPLDTIIAIARVARVAPLENRNFDIGVELTKIINGDVKTIFKHAKEAEKIRI